MYKAIVQASLMVNVDYLVLAVPNQYVYNKDHADKKPTTLKVYAAGRDILGAIYASRRLELPLAGVLLIGY